MNIGQELFKASDAKTYEGTKRLKAWPLSKGMYCAYRGWITPAGEDPEEAGYLVEYLDGGKPNDDRHEGYISWSPADVFEKTYRECVEGANSAVSSEDQAEWRGYENRRMALDLASRGREGHAATAVLETAIAFLSFLNAK